MSYCFTSFSTMSSVSGAGAHTISGIPAAFAYSKSFRISASSGLFQ